MAAKSSPPCRKNSGAPPGRPTRRPPARTPWASRNRDDVGSRAPGKVMAAAPTVVMCTGRLGAEHRAAARRASTLRRRAEGKRGSRREHAGEPTDGPRRPPAGGDALALVASGLRGDRWRRQGRRRPTTPLPTLPPTTDHARRRPRRWCRRSTSCRRATRCRRSPKMFGVDRGRAGRRQRHHRPGQDRGGSAPQDPAAHHHDSAGGRSTAGRDHHGGARDGARTCSSRRRPSVIRRGSCAVRLGQRDDLVHDAGRARSPSACRRRRRRRRERGGRRRG